MPMTMHAVGWRVVASAALDEAAAGDEAVDIVRVGCRAVGRGAIRWRRARGGGGRHFQRTLHSMAQTLTEGY